MKKTISFVVAAIVSVQFLMAQSVADGIKYLDYTFKSQTARQVLKKNYEANPKDPKAIYWYGQAMIAGGDVSKEDVAAAKSFYQKALADGVNDPWIWVGIGHMELLEGGDINAAKQKFEQAITATTATRGRNKGKASPEILDAIGRANADGGSKVGDPMYGIEKLKEAIAIDPNTPDHYIHMGICYLKLGGENGGEAVKAFQDAISHDPKCAEAMFRIGRVYASQNNYEAFSKYFDDAIAADPNFPDVYLAYFEYYKFKDVNKAKSYLDKFIATADKDPRNDFYLADYLFRAGNYNESIAKAKEIEASAGGVAAVPRLNILYAYDYDRLGDSVQSRSYLEKFFNSAPQTQIQPTDYELAVKVFSKFPGSETTAVGYLEKAIANDTSKVNKMNYMGQAAELMGKAKMYDQELKWMIQEADLKGTWSELDYYKITSTAYSSKLYDQTIDLAKKYLAAFPDKPQPYSFLKRAALAADPDTTKGIALAGLDYLDSMYMKDKEKNKKEIFRNLFFRLNYYVYKTKELEKALEVTDKMLALYPEPGEENKYAADTKAIITDALNKRNQPAKPSKAGAGKAGEGPSKK